jgi:Tfp pilus assembly protein PilF
VSSGSVPQLEEAIAKVLLAGSEGSGKDWVRRKAPTPESHALYLRARQEWNRRDQQSIERARDLFAQAIDLEPTYARAYAGVADCYLLLGGYGAMPQLESLLKAKAMATRALEIDPQLPEAWATLGLIVQNLDWDWKVAEQHYLRAIEIDPTYATAQHWYAEFLSIQGRFEESHRHFAQARKLDPLTPMIASDEALAYIYARDWEKARQVLEQVLQLEPGQPDTWERLAWVDALEGKEEAAWRKVQQIEACRREQSPCAVRWTAWLPSRGRERAALALARMEADPGQFPLYCRLIAQSRQGNHQRALAVFREMKEKHAIWLITAKVNPWFDGLRADPGVRNILAQLGWN